MAAVEYQTGYDERVNALTCLASFDESREYEVDRGGIYRNDATGDFYFITASGCSCWSGEYWEEEFSTFIDLAKSLLAEDRWYNPTPETAKLMIRESWDILRSLQENGSV